MSQMYTLYKHVNLINNKIYIGITLNDVNRRWQNGSGYKNNKHFYNAIKKYGWNDGFSHEILFVELSKEEAEIKEIELINFYKSNNSNYGYNIDNGGNANGKMSILTKQKISNANKGKKRTKESKKIMSEKAKNMTLEHKNKISQKNKGKTPWNKGLKLSDEEIKQTCSIRKVLCIELNKIFMSL